MQQSQKSKSLTASAVSSLTTSKRCCTKANKSCSKRLSSATCNNPSPMTSSRETVRSHCNGQLLPARLELSLPLSLSALIDAQHFSSRVSWCFFISRSRSTSSLFSSSLAAAAACLNCSSCSSRSFHAELQGNHAKVCYKLLYYFTMAVMNILPHFTNFIQEMLNVGGPMLLHHLLL